MTETQDITVEEGNQLYKVKVPKALKRGMVVEWPQGRDAKFAIVGLTPEEVHGLLCQLVAQTHALTVQYRADLVQAAYTTGRGVGRREAAALPVMDSDAA